MSSNNESTDREGFAQALRLCGDVKNGKELPRTLPSADCQMVSSQKVARIFFDEVDLPENLMY